MSTDSDDLPDGWTRAEDSDEQAGQYDPQQPIRYGREDIEVHAQPATNVSGEGDLWRVGIIREDGPGGVETLHDGIEGRDSAIEIAREFMETYNERHVEGNESIDDVISSFG
ncbi:MAG TPA: hypothetical protein VFJ06_13595 [Halococcus sp.]|nr:hypothetical protein [Halococcus sp.]